ncbi:uncharacterized protein LOC111024290 [Momordica charantia]|uniref:Uncharacterized protein LOC111024290 n=1 Tax=Momordica charantia TaxID=3673 RepID=A0A6J1DX10_MOMCH|nr:uncharacterized protein LOC111024290 [Momordica charantia]
MSLDPSGFLRPSSKRMDLLNDTKLVLLPQGYTQVEGLDYAETFSPVIKPTTIRLVLALAVTSKWPLKQLDVKNAFLHGYLKEVVYISQPPGFQDDKVPHFVCKLNRSLYGLKQAPRAWKMEASISATPMALAPPSSPNDDEPVDTTSYRSIVGSLQYLSLTRPDIIQAVNKIYQHFQSPTVKDLKEVKRILRYLVGTTHLGITIYKNHTLNLYAFCDTDWGGCPVTRQSTIGFCVYLGSNIISWSSKKQPTIARSSSESEYRAMATTTTEITLLTFLLREIGIPLLKPPELLCDNLSAL